MALSAAIVLAAGEGTRMRSNKPKVLHAFAGKTFLNRVMDSVAALNPDTLAVVVHFQAERVAEAARRHVQADGRQTGQPLPGQRGNAAPENFLGSLRAQAEAAGLDGDIARTAGHEQKHRKTDGLSNGRGDSCARHLHVQHENKDGVQNDIEDGTSGNADHAVKGAPLKAKLTEGVYLLSIA